MRQASTMKRTTIQSATSKNRFETPSAQPVFSQEDFNQKVAQKAHELFVARGCAHGYDVEDWLQAEQIVKRA